MPWKESVKKIDVEVKKLKEKLEKEKKRNISSIKKVNYDTFSLIF